MDSPSSDASSLVPVFRGAVASHVSTSHKVDVSPSPSVNSAPQTAVGAFASSLVDVLAPSYSAPADSSAGSLPTDLPGAVPSLAPLDRMLRPRARSASAATEASASLSASPSSAHLSSVPTALPTLTQSSRPIAFGTTLVVRDQIASGVGLSDFASNMPATILPDASTVASSVGSALPSELPSSLPSSYSTGLEIRAAPTDSDYLDSLLPTATAVPSSVLPSAAIPSTLPSELPSSFGTTLHLRSFIPASAVSSFLSIPDVAFPTPPLSAMSTFPTPLPSIDPSHPPSEFAASTEVNVKARSISDMLPPLSSALAGASHLMSPSSTLPLPTPSATPSGAIGIDYRPDNERRDGEREAPEEASSFREILPSSLPSLLPTSIMPTSSLPSDLPSSLPSTFGLQVRSIVDTSDLAVPVSSLAAMMDDALMPTSSTPHASIAYSAEATASVQSSAIPSAIRSMRSGPLSMGRGRRLVRALSTPAPNNNMKRAVANSRARQVAGNTYERYSGRRRYRRAAVNHLEADSDRADISASPSLSSSLAPLSSITPAPRLVPLSIRSDPSSTPLEDLASRFLDAEPTTTIEPSDLASSVDAAAATAAPSSADGGLGLGIMQRMRRSVADPLQMGGGPVSGMFGAGVDNVNAGREQPVLPSIQVSSL